MNSRCINTHKGMHTNTQTHTHQECVKPPGGPNWMQKRGVDWLSKNPECPVCLFRCLQRAPPL